MRLIDADALIAQIEANICKPCKERKDDYHGVRCRACQYGDEIDDIDSAPTVEERKTGAWISDGVRFKGGHEWIHCSECGLETLDTPLNRTNYCPNCGCFMKEGNDKWVYR